MNNPTAAPSIVRTFPLADLLNLAPNTHVVIIDENNCILGIGGFVRYGTLEYPQPVYRSTEVAGRKLDGWFTAEDSIVLDTGEFPFPIDGEAYYAPAGWRP